MSAPFAKGSKLDPRIKPPQWGPASAVQSAIFHNAERAGIDPGSIDTYFPFWERAGEFKKTINFGNNSIQSIYNYANWVIGDGGAAAQVNPTDYPRALVYQTEDFYPANLSEYTLIITTQIKSPSTYQTFFGASPSENIGTGASADSIRTRQDRDDITTSNVDLTKPTMYCLSNKNGRKVYIDGKFRNSGSSRGLSFNSISPWALGARGYGTPTGLWYFYSYMLFTRALTDSQIAHIYEQPYALLYPVARPIFFDVGATPGPATPTNLQGTPSTDSILWTWEAGS